jgi:hypothetical protein
MHDWAQTSHLDSTLDVIILPLLVDGRRQRST